MKRIKGHQHGIARSHIVNGEITPLDLQQCTKCQEIKSVNDFIIRKVNRRTYSWCRSCQNINAHKWRKEGKGKEVERRRHLRVSFGITPEEYNAMVEAQGNLCAICKQPERYSNPRNGSPCKLAIDHCHKTGKVRQLLCRRCNQVLGQYDDDVSMFMNCIDYLNKHK